MSPFSRVAARALATLTLAAVASCAGKSERREEAGGGRGGTGGTDPGSCEHDGRTYDDGESFPAGDGCNTCTCRGGGVGCTLIDCPPDARCDIVATEFEDALERARACTVGDPEGCVQIAPSGLQCGCPTFVNESTELGVLAMEWAGLDCGRGVVCGACPPAPIRGYCVQGGCVDVFDGT